VRNVFIILIAVLIGAFFIFKPAAPLPQIASPTPAASAKPAGVMVQVNGVAYRVFLQVINQNDEVTLIPNFKNSLSSTEIISKFHCMAGINGGFYDTARHPLGVFWITPNYINKNLHDTSFFNGFVYKPSFGSGLTFSADMPKPETTEFVFQTGPAFSPQTVLHILNDEADRRMLLGKTTEGKLYALAITESENTNSGPRLTDVPQIIAQLPQHFSQAVNLDGGSASAFASRDETELSELTSVGSFLCIK
jgi:hypothetical protein